MRPAAVFALPLALGAAVMLVGRNAQAAPTPITACQTISKPGSYQLGKNLSAASANCLVITASFVTIDLAGFTITGSTGGGTAISAPSSTFGITVLNGSISGFFFGVYLAGSGSIVERLQVSGGPSHISAGITANGIVKDNVVSGVVGAGISAGGTVIGNNAFDNGTGIGVVAASTVIGNTSTHNNIYGILVACPSNVTNNTAVGNPAANLALSGTGCNNTNNVAP